MAQLSILDFVGKFNNILTGLFKNNTTRDITPERVRTLVTDIGDSFYNKEDDDIGLTRKFNRTFSETLVFDKNEIFYSAHTATGNITFEIGSGNLVDESSGVRMVITLDGTQSLNFGSGFDYLYGIANGEVKEAGTYEIYFLYTNGHATVNFPGVSAQSSGTTVLAVPDNFAATPNVSNPETELDLSWDDVSNESSYLIEFSLTGTGGWSTLSTPAADATTSTQTGLSAGNTRYYRIKAIGDGVSFLDSAFSTVISGQTESSGDVTAPTFTFFPANGNSEWTVNRPLTITANEPIRNADGSEITSANVASRITLKETNSGGANISFTATIDGTKQIITITPATHYGENQLVYLAINNVEDVNGNEVTVAVSITFTTTEQTYFNGTTNRVQFGDILDSLFTPNNTNFWLELTVKNVNGSGIRPLVTKYDTAGNQREFQWYISGSDVYFGYVKQLNGVGSRVIKWTGAISGEHVLVLKYDGAIDTSDGLDRVTLLVDGVTAGSKTLFATDGEAIASIIITNGTAQLAVGSFINAAGNPVGSSFFADEAKDFIVRSASGSVVEINVHNLKLGTDSSGNARHGSFI